MPCSRCRHENPPLAKFCLECGARLVQKCAQRGVDLPAGAKFCLTVPAGGDALELSVVIPCLDEAETLATVIREARAALDRAGIRGEIVVGDNGSTDGSQEIARHEGARVVDVTDRGYGSALMGAIAGSRGRYVGMGDADASYDFDAL